jgi:hypothetical protein
VTGATGVDIEDFSGNNTGRFCRHTISDNVPSNGLSQGVWGPH